MNRLAELILDDASLVVGKLNHDELSRKRVLITGASGLIGTHLLASLSYLRSEAGLPLKVYGVVNSEPEEYFVDIAEFGDAEILRGDLTDPGFVRSLPESDLIIHAAGYGQPGKFLQDPAKTIALNTSTLLGLLEKVTVGGKLLFLSTSEVYTGAPRPPYRETDIGNTNTDHPRACYIEAKRCGETICIAYRQKGIDAKSARIALAYGPGTRAGDRRVINEFIHRGIEGEISLLDHGQARRTYCYVADAVEILWDILLTGADPIYNVGGSSRVTIRELALKIAEYLSVSVSFPSDIPEGLAGAPEDVFLDMTKAKREFGKSEYVDLAQGLERTIEWQKLYYSSTMRGDVNG
jgi:UDP-glucuronate decarboxylase